MLKPFAQYLRAEAAPRWKDIVVSWETAFSIIVILVVWKFGNRLFLDFPKVSDLTTGLIAYAAIALGFCVAGLTISLTFPEPKFTSKLVLSAHEVRANNPYSDLIFVFSWTAVTHWFALLALFGAVLLTDGGKALLPNPHSQTRTVAVALIAGLCAYALCQFLITLITLSQVGNLYVRFLVNRVKEISNLR